MFFLALWRSPFRPFFLLGALYGTALLLSWIAVYTGLLPPLWHAHSALPSLYHQHEIIFGFSTAIIFGFILTALPSWAGTVELVGARLALLTLIWAAGRVAVLLSGWLPALIVAAVDLAFAPVFAALVGPGLRDANRRFQLGLAVITAGFFCGNLGYYLGVWLHAPQLWWQGLHLGLYAIIFHCSVTVGVLAPIFTENALREIGRPASIGHVIPLEWLSALCIIALALLDVTGTRAPVIGIAAALCCALHGVRLYRWHSLRITGTPIVWVLHLGYAWLVLALALLALRSFGMDIPVQSWVHAFTIGGFGLMSLGLMTRVALRHTGRNMHPAQPMVVGYLCLAAAAAVRVAVPSDTLRHELLLLSALLWAIPYVIYLTLYGRMLLLPSLPKLQG
ncbi:MAG: NnrS family protein [Halioglobus sp.]|nr:NnrS family protein [Halioglobus sp.]